jgi:hypothetical protein
MTYWYFLIFPVLEVIYFHVLYLIRYCCGLRIALIWLYWNRIYISNADLDPGARKMDQSNKQTRILDF